MTDFYFTREELTKFLPDDRTRRRFDEMQRTVAQNDQIVTANVESTGALSEATFVTLSPNDELPNEFVLSVADGIDIEVAAGQVILRLGNAAVHATGESRIVMTAEGDSNIAVPLNGYLATRANTETLTNKTLGAPILSGLGDYTDDAAAAADGVPVGGMYHDTGALRVRLV